MKSELSKRNKFYVPPERYYELLHFVKQYPVWISACTHLEAMAIRRDFDWVKGTDISDPVAKVAIAKNSFQRKIDMVNQAAKNAGGEIWENILKGVIGGKSYDVMNANNPLPVSRDEYYARYRYFFWCLSKLRD